MEMVELVCWNWARVQWWDQYRVWVLDCLLPVLTDFSTSYCVLSLVMNYISLTCIHI